MLNLRLGYLFSNNPQQICIVGGGSAGLNISAHLLKTFPASEMNFLAQSHPLLPTGVHDDWWGTLLPAEMPLERQGMSSRGIFH